MNTKITRNQLSDKPIIKIGYCAAQFILNNYVRIGYMSGVYGWNCDVYEFDKAYIVTGYRFYGLSGVHADYDTVNKYEKTLDEKYMIWDALQREEFAKIAIENIIINTLQA